MVASRVGSTSPPSTTTIGTGSGARVPHHIPATTATSTALAASAIR
jgi:hypothetical protein